MLTYEWKKSPRSNGTGGSNCVETKLATGGNEVLVRDTKDNGAGPILAFSKLEWLAFIEGVKSGDFDL
jgi:Domain of unknown function (DUF397)